jgi:hypothetical protein
MDGVAAHASAFLVAAIRSADRRESQAMTPLLSIPSGLDAGVAPSSRPGSSGPVGFQATGVSAFDHGGDNPNPATAPSVPSHGAAPSGATTAHGQVALPAAKLDQSGFSALLNDSVARGRATLTGPQPAPLASSAAVPSASVAGAPSAPAFFSRIIAMPVSLAAAAVPGGVQASGPDPSVPIRATRPGGDPIPAIPALASPGADSPAVRRGKRRLETSGAPASAPSRQPDPTTAANTKLVTTPVALVMPQDVASAAPGNDVATPTIPENAAGSVAAAPTSLVAEMGGATGRGAQPTATGRHGSRHLSVSVDQPEPPHPIDVVAVLDPPTVNPTLLARELAAARDGSATGAALLSADHQVAGMIAPVSHRRPSITLGSAASGSDISRGPEAPTVTSSASLSNGPKVATPLRSIEAPGTGPSDLSPSLPIPAGGSPMLPLPSVAPLPSATAATGSPAAAPATQIASAVVSLAPAGTQTTILRLQPAELGHLQITLVRAADGPVSVALVVERPETLLLLLRDQPRLNQALDQAGVPAEARTLSFDLAASSASLSGNTNGEPAADHAAHRHSPPEAGSPGASAGDLASPGGNGPGDPQGRADRSFAWTFATDTQSPLVALAVALPRADAPARMALSALDITA